MKLNKEALRQMGAEAYARLRRGWTVERACAWIDGWFPPSCAWVSDQAFGGKGSLLVLGWAINGFQVIEPAHRLAASLMATHANPESLLDLRPPWPTFALQIPSGLLSNEGGLSIVSCSSTGPCHMLVLWSDRSSHDEMVIHWLRRSSLAEFASPGVPITGADEYAFNPNEVDAAKRKNLLLSRLLTNVCIEMDNRRGSAPSGKTHNRRKSPVPETSVFRLTRPVVLDVRTQVRDYVEGRIGSSPTVQSLVRGHWKQQPCGPNGVDRKKIHVEPYWRGPEDMPIAVRSHLLPELSAR